MKSRWFVSSILCAAGFFGDMVFGQTDLILSGGSSTQIQQAVSYPSVIVGQTDGGNRLTIDNGGVVSSFSSVIGESDLADTNHVWVSGSGSSWNTAGTLTLGLSGAGNGLTVMNGGSVHSMNLTLGANTSSITNYLTVSDTDSLLMVTNKLVVGGRGRDNSLTISNGGMVVVGGELEVNSALNLNQDGTLMVKGLAQMGAGFNYNEGATLIVSNGSLSNFSGTLSDEQTFVLDGVSAQWIGASNVDFLIGAVSNGAYNTVVLTNGASLHTISSTIGAAYGAHSNRVVLNGSNTSWRLDGDLMVGQAYAHDNTMIVGDKSRAQMTGLQVGNGGSNNLFQIASGGEAEVDRVSVSSGGNAVHVMSDGRLIVNGGLDLDALGQGLIRDTNSMLEVSGVLTATNMLHDGGNTLVLNGGSWSNNQELTVGGQLAGNVLVVTNGGRMASTGGVIGKRATSDGNDILFSGSNTQWVSAGDIWVGDEGAGNHLVITNGAMLSSYEGTIGALSGADRNMVLVSGSTWTNINPIWVGDNGADNTLTVEKGGALYSSRGFIGSSTGAGGNTVWVQDSNSLWRIENELKVGDWGSDNALVITNGAVVSAGKWAAIGSSTAASNNEVMVSGAGSSWAVGESLTVGVVGNSGNGLWVLDQAQVMMGSNLMVQGLGNQVTLDAGGLLAVNGDADFANSLVASGGSRLEVGGAVSGLGGEVAGGYTLHLKGPNASWTTSGDKRVEGSSTLDIGSGALVSAANYYQASNAVLRFEMSTNAVSSIPETGLLSVSGTATLEKDAELALYTDFGAFKTEAFYTNLLVDASTLVVGGITNATTVDLDYLTTTDRLANVSFRIMNNDLFVLVNRNSMALWSGATGQLADIMDVVDQAADDGHAKAGNQVNLVYGMSTGEARQQMSQLYLQSAPFYEHSSGVLGGINEVFKRTSRALIDTTAYIGTFGAAGPSGQVAWRTWGRGYGEYADRGSENGLAGYDSSLNGTVVGLDRAMGKLMVGLGAGLAHSVISQDNRDRSTADTGYGVAYGSIRGDTVESHFLLAYGTSDVDSFSGGAFGSKAAFDASHLVMKFGLDGELVGDRYTLTPEASVQAVRYAQENYQERSPHALGRDVRGMERWGYQSFLGGTYAFVRPMEGVDFISRIRAGWQHEFNADTEAVGFRVEGDNGWYSLQMQAPVKDRLLAGFGVSARIEDKVEVGFGAEAQGGDGFIGVQYNGSFRVDF